MSKGDNRSLLLIRVEAVFRELSWRFSKNNIFLTEYPKSGGSWFCQLVSDILEIDFPRNTFPKFSNSILQGHKKYDKNLKIDNIFLLVRDGRDVMVSAYHYFLYKNDRNNHKFVDDIRKRSGIDLNRPIEENLPKFIEFMFTEKIGLIDYGNWSQFNDKWLDNINRERIIKYEDLRMDTFNVLDSMFTELKYTDYDDNKIYKAIEKYDIKNQVKKTEGKTFIRKGQPGEWKDCFSLESKEVFKHYGGQTLINFEYENKLDW